MPSKAMIAKTKNSNPKEKTNKQFLYPNAYAANHSDDSKKKLTE